MEGLPLDVYCYIFQFIDDKDLLNVALLNHWFNNLMQKQIIWRHRIKQWVYNLEKPEPNITKKKYVKLLRKWHKLIDPKFIIVNKNADCLCKKHIYGVDECFDYIKTIPEYSNHDVFIPLKFWFNTDSRSALPMF